MKSEKYKRRFLPWLFFLFHHPHDSQFSCSEPATLGKTTLVDVDHFLIPFSLLLFGASYHHCHDCHLHTISEVIISKYPTQQTAPCSSFRVPPTATATIQVEESVQCNKYYYCFSEERGDTAPACRSSQEAHQPCREFSFELFDECGPSWKRNDEDKKMNQKSPNGRLCLGNNDHKNYYYYFWLIFVFREAIHESASVMIVPETFRRCCRVAFLEAKRMRETRI